MGQCLTKVNEVINGVNKVNEVNVNEVINKVNVNEVSLVKGHERNMSNHYIVQYPDHVPRKPTAIYNKTHKALKGMPCFICGAHGSGAHGSGAHGIETHHFYCEKAAQNAIDWNVFGKFAKNCHNIQTGENIGNFDWEEVAKNPDIFVDSPYNMITLCKEHHTSGHKGIHHVPFPDWILQKFSKDGFIFLK